MKIPIQNIYYLLAYAWGHADEARDREAGQVAIETLPDLLAHLLAVRTGTLLRRGLDRTYVEEEFESPGIRGKLDVGLTIKRQLLLRGRTMCRVEELRHDVMHNQIIRSTLRNLLRLEDLGPQVRAEVALVHSRLTDIQEISIRRSSFRRLRIHRNNRPYRS